MESEQIRSPGWIYYNKGDILMREWNADTVADIALMFMDGDAVEELLLDPLGHTDYHFEHFTKTKRVLGIVERMDPDLDISAFVWLRRRDNPRIVYPAVIGRTFPLEGWQRIVAGGALLSVFESGKPTVLPRRTGESRYYPLRNSSHEMVAVLELLCGASHYADI